MRITEENKKQQFDAFNVGDFHTIKPKICYKLVNAKRNESLLKQLPSRPCQDLAVLYYILISDSEERLVTATIRNELMEYWGVTEETLFELATQNTSRLLGCTVRPIETVLNELLDNTLKEEYPFEACSPEETSMYVVSNMKNQVGATALLYTNVLQDFSKWVGGDFYILPSSIHELLFITLPPNMAPEELLQMVREINRECVDLEEILSNNVYHYRADAGCIEMLE